MVLVDITQRKNANASGTVIPQQLRDNEPLCNVQPPFHKHDTTGSERHTYTGPTHSVNGVGFFAFYFPSFQLMLPFAPSFLASLELG